MVWCYASDAVLSAVAHRFPRSSVQNLLRLAQADKVQYGLRLKRNRTREGNHCRNNGGNHGWNANIFFVWYEFWTRDFKQLTDCAC